MKLRNLAETAQTIDAANGMRVEAGEISGNIPKAIAESLTKNQPETWAAIKKPKEPENEVFKQGDRKPKPTKGGK